MRYGSELKQFQSLLWWICHFDTEIQNMVKQGLSCFNPCYDGFVILTVQVLHLLFYHLWVSILVMMDLSFWLTDNIDDKVYVYNSFNPCYDGFVILTFSLCYFQFHLLRFNPCYDGFVILTLVALQTEKQEESFNPCYDGFVILTFLSNLQPLHSQWFQSLLWWICHFDCVTI